MPLTKQVLDTDWRTPQTAPRVRVLPESCAGPTTEGGRPMQSPDAQAISEQAAFSRSATPAEMVEVRLHDSGDIEPHLRRLEAYLQQRGPFPLSRHPGWLSVLQKGLNHRPYCLEALQAGRTCGFLPLAFIRSVWFGRFLVSLPYLNYGGVVVDDEPAAIRLIDRAVELAERLDVRYLELRHEQPLEHPALSHRADQKVHMRLALPRTVGELWDQLSAKVRNQVRKGQKGELSVCWGRQELLAEFYAVFSRNMRDLGTPVYSDRLFRSVLEQFPTEAELCIVRAGHRPLAAALLTHGRHVSEVPSASSLRKHNDTCANMLLYWHLLERSIERGQAVFDFGRSSLDSNTYRFKKQWGAEPHSAQWLYYLRRGSLSDMRPDNPRYRPGIRIWQRLPVWLTRLLGPTLVRGIP